MEELVRFIASNLVDNPDDVAVSTRETPEGGRVLELRVAEEDRGKVIGKKGRTAHAIRAILNAANTGEGSINLDILD